MSPVFHFFDYPTGSKLAQFFCEGCQELHVVHVKGSETYRSPVWEWDGNEAKPTLAPSILVTCGERRCHSFIRGGMIEFLSDCSHQHARKTIPLVAVTDWPERLKSYKLG